MYVIRWCWGQGQWAKHKFAICFVDGAAFACETIGTTLTY